MLHYLLRKRNSVPVNSPGADNAEQMHKILVKRPFARLRSTFRPAEVTRLLKYDSLMASPIQDQYFGHSQHFNYGFSRDPDEAQADASTRLVAKLLEAIPTKEGTILDVACGLGGSTQQLLEYYPSEKIYAINLSRWQLGQARRNAPGCAMLQMDASHLAFPDASFESILCVESAFHFKTRADFLREALRVLKPGGRLVLSDIIGELTMANNANSLDGPLDYADLMHRIGFMNVTVMDATKESITYCAQRLRQWPLKEWGQGRLSIRRFFLAAPAMLLYSAFMEKSHRYYVLCHAQKPEIHKDSKTLDTATIPA